LVFLRGTTRGTSPLSARALPLNPSYVVAITGPRQAGKTFRLYQLVLELARVGVPRSNILYMNFERERLRRLDANDLEDLPKVYYEMFEPSNSYPVYLLLTRSSWSGIGTSV